MPRAVNPHLGDDGYDTDIGDDVVVTPNEVENLLNGLTCDHRVNANDLARTLTAIRMNYRRRAKRGIEAFTRAEARAALDKVLVHPVVTAHEVISLNERALSVVHDQLIKMKGIWEPDDSPFEMLYNDALPAETLRAACVGARELMMSTKGPELGAALPICVDELCALYEKLTGTLMTLSNKGENRVHISAPCSTGGKFVLEAARLVIGEWRNPHPNKMPSAVSSCIRDWINNRVAREEVLTSRTHRAANPITGCLPNEGDTLCTIARPRTSLVEAANDREHARPQGRKERDRVAQTRSEKRPDT
jgi:hypothetical protein